MTTLNIGELNKAGAAGVGPGAGAGATMAPPVAEAKPMRAAKPADKRGWWWGTGRRKSAVARIRMRPAKGGEGKITLIGPSGKERSVEEYFAEERDRKDCILPLKMNNLMGKFDVVAKMHGGGFMGQAQAMRLALARAVRDYDPTLDKPMRVEGLLTRDAREVERKKYGQAGARRRFQFSKR